MLRHKNGKADTETSVERKIESEKEDETICYALSTVCVCAKFYMIFYCIMVFLLSILEMDTH